MGLAPQVRRRLKIAMGRQIGLQRTGNIDILFDMHSRHQDPDYGSFMSQVRIYRRFYGNWPEATHKTLERSWTAIRDRLLQAQHPWQVAKGPVAALICHLLERDWDCTHYGLWTKPGHNGSRDFRLDMTEDWFALREELKRAERWERIEKINKRSMLGEVQYTLDWTPWRRMNKTLNSRNSTALATWHQGALFTKISDTEEDKHLQCPHCGQKATLLHLLWLCKETKRQFRELDAEDQFELDHGINLEFWTQGLLMMPRHELPSGGAAAQAWGSWTLQDEMKISNTAVFTIGIAATSKDPRLRHFVVALVQHAKLGEELYRLGVVATILPGHQSLERAWYYGLRMAAHYIKLSEQIRFHILSTKAWEAWVHGKHDHIFHDLASLVTADERHQIKALCLTMQQVKQMPKGALTLRSRFHDATKAATEVALAYQPKVEEAILQEQDKKYQKIAPLAVQRIRYILDTKDHFTHQARETGKTLRSQTQEQKKQAYNALTAEQAPGTHSWVTKGRGKQCTLCLKRLTLHSKLPDIIQAGQERCAGNPGSTLGGADHMQQDTETKSQMIQQILDGTLPEAGGHLFKQQGSYLVCQLCGTRTLRNTAKEKIKAMAVEPCINQAWQPDQPCGGHATHRMWRKAKGLRCQACRAQAMWQKDKWVPSKTLKAPCGEKADTTQLPLLFKAKTASPSP